MRKNCSSDREIFLKSKVEGQEFSKNLRSLEQFNSETSEQFLKQNAFLNYFLVFTKQGRKSKLIYKQRNIFLPG